MGNRYYDGNGKLLALVTHAAGQKSCGRHAVRLKIERRSENPRADLLPIIQVALNGILEKS